jgi:hypothetical protein
MTCLIDAPQPIINVCVKIKCPFFNQACASPKCCARYQNSSHCHLTSVFAFKCERQGLFTFNAGELSSVKMANDGWIARDRANQRQLRLSDRSKSSKPIRERDDRELDSPIFYPYDDNCPSFNFPTSSSNFQPISTSLLNSIHFEDY